MPERGPSNALERKRWLQSPEGGNHAFGHGDDCEGCREVSMLSRCKAQKQVYPGLIRCRLWLGHDGQHKHWLEGSREVRW